MKTTLLALALTTILIPGLCSGQASSNEESQPASSNVSGQQYPRIDAELRCTFQLKAPDAQKVRLHLDKDYDMERGTNGVWSVTSTPQVPGFHYYWFMLDGANRALLRARPIRRRRISAVCLELCRRSSSTT
jgi:enterochelin esterase family protein